MANEFHPALLASDITDLESGAGDGVVSGLRYGVPAALTSGVLSIYNTFANYKDKLVGNESGTSQIDTQEIIEGYSQQSGDYYTAHKQGVDIAGMVATSLLPGTLGIKALQIARGGNALGSVGKVLNIAASNKDKYLRAALQDVASTAGVIPKLLSGNRLKYMAYETADQVLLAAAGEAAIAATMNQSSVFAGDTLGDFGWNMALGAGVGGVVGGALSSIAAKGILRTAGTQLQGQSRALDTVFAGDALGLSKGTETLQLATDISKLANIPDDIEFAFRLDGKLHSETLKSTAALQAAKDRAVKTAENKLAEQFTVLAEGDANFGQAYYKLISEGLDGAKAAGMDAAERIDLVHGYLANVAKVGRIDLDQYVADSKIFYVKTTPKFDTVESLKEGLFTKTRSKETTRQGYRLADDVTASDVVIEDFDAGLYKNFTEAFRARPDVDLFIKDGRYVVNTNSSIIKRAHQTPYVVRKYIRAADGTISDEAVPTFADIVNRGNIQVTDSSISAGAVRSFKQPPSIATAMLPSALDASARWGWASKLEAGQFLRVTGGAVMESDLPMLARLQELSGSMAPSTLDKFTVKAGNELIPAMEYLAQDAGVHGARSRTLIEMLDQANKVDSVAGKTSEHLAAYLNTPIDYVESLIASEFKPSAMVRELLDTAGPTSTALTPKTVMVEWNFGVAKRLLPEEAYNLNMGPSHLATKELTREYQMLIRADIGTKAQTVGLGEHMALFTKAPDVRDPNSKVTIEGAGASGFGASNADYIEKAKLWVQDTGKSVMLATQRLRDAAIETLSPSVNAIRTDMVASTELGSITTALRKSPHRFSVFEDVTGPGESTKMLISRDAKKAWESGEFNNIDEAIEYAVGQDGLTHNFPLKSESVIDFLETTALQNTRRQGKMTVLYNAAGLARNGVQAGEIYVPPVNTQKYPFFALIKPKQTVGLGTDVTMITAKSEEQLRQYAAKLSDKFEVHYKADTDSYYKAKGQYDYQMTVNEGTINAELHRAGVLADIMPETRAENVLTDWLEWTAREEEKLVRTSVQVGNRQFFSEMQFLSENYRTVPESQARGLGAKLKKAIDDPFGDYIKTALNISKRGEFPLLDSLNELVDKAGYIAGQAIVGARRDAMKGVLPWQDAQKIMKEYGLGQGLDESLYRIANEEYPSNLIKDTLAKGNMWLATTTLRLDFINPLINMVSTPIMIGTEVSALRKLMAGDSKLAADFEAVMSVAGPGGRSMPSTTKLISNSISNFFGADKELLLGRYKEIGAIKGISQLYHEVLDDLSYKSVVNPGKYAAKIEAAVEKGSKLTGNNFAEEFTRFVSADVMRQISEPLGAAGKLTVKEQNMFLSTFVNRVQGNYVTSQRPIVFQGTTGSAVSLFQTYAFNVLQQLTRHIENSDKRTLMLFAGLQGSVFGLNGLPFFDAVNTHLVGSWLANNPQHNDSYNILPKFNKELGDWALYGSASAFPLFSDRAPALYTRGDINPRHITILPTAIADIPVVQASTKLYDTVTGFGKNVAGGADVSRAMLQALEHQGWNRPLAGMAQALGGQTTTSNGSIISATSELETTSKLMALQHRMVDFGGVTRMLGSRPMDEAIALNNLYRNKSYDALDKERIERLGTVVKTKLASNQVPEQEEVDDFMLRYTRVGGRIENFSQSYQRWMRDANVSVINQALRKVGTPSNLKLQAIMGGEGLEDRMTAPPQQEE